MIRAFVSSTFRDLEKHRAYVIDRLERSGIFVDPMEKWTAASDEPKNVSTERVRDCQLFILLVGFQLGHVPDGDSRSITQQEYDEAVRCEIDTLVFLANPEDPGWSAGAITTAQDPAVVAWRDGFQEHQIVGKFTPAAESIDIDAAVSRWLQKQTPIAPKGGQDGAEAAQATIDIRGYSNSEGVLVVWRTSQRIDGCLGFALHCKELGLNGTTERLITSFAGFQDEADSHGPAGPGNQHPIQKFRWFDFTQAEVRYRVSPIMGTPGKLSETEDVRAGSAWTPWLTPRTGHAPLYRALFNNTSLSQMMVRKFGGRSTADTPGTYRLLQGNPDLAERLGGGLRQNLLALLSNAKTTGRRVYAALTDLDDPWVAAALAVLGDNAHVIITRSSRSRGPPQARYEQACRQLSKTSVHFHERKAAHPGLARANFAILCDRWGTPISVWSGSGAWTMQALCLSANNAVLVESVPLARAYLDLWESLLANHDPKARSSARRSSMLAHVRAQGSSATLWNPPLTAKADLRDAGRLIRGARQGLLFLVNGRCFASGLMSDIKQIARDRDLFVEGLSWSAQDGTIKLAYYHGNGLDKFSLCSSNVPGSTIVLVDPFGPHPVVMAGSHDLSEEISAKGESDLLIIENVAGLAAEYAVHLLGLFDHYRFRTFLTMYDTGKSAPLMTQLQHDDRWQDRYFTGDKRREFNFLFGSLSPGAR